MVEHVVLQHQAQQLTPHVLRRKALYGLLSDTISCCGYRKRGYIVACSTVAVAVFAVLAAVPFEEETAVIAAILFFFASVDVSVQCALWTSFGPIKILWTLLGLAGLAGRPSCAGQVRRGSCTI